MRHRHEPGSDQPNEVTTRTVDGVELRGLYLRGPAPAAGTTAFVICHGMTNATSKASTRGVLDAFTGGGSVVAFDFRGHGRSGGASTVGRDEVRDVDSAIAFARAAGHRKVALVGFSMGAGTVIRHAGSTATDPLLTEQADVVIAVSAPARWFLRESRSMLRVQWLLEHPLGGLLGRRLGIRLSVPWDEVPSTPLQEVGSIVPTPLLLIHGTADHYFGPEQATMLHRAAPGSELWLVDGMGHAESGISRATIDRAIGWVADRLTDVP